MEQADIVPLLVVVACMQAWVCHQECISIHATRTSPTWNVFKCFAFWNFNACQLGTDGRGAVQRSNVRTEGCSSLCLCPATMPSLLTCWVGVVLLIRHV